jgi:hypothetical protein
LIVTAPVAVEVGTEGEAARWGFELQGNDGRGRMRLVDDPESAVGKTSLQFTPNPYPGQYATAIFPGARDAQWNWSGKTKVSLWIKANNPNLPGFQSPGPVLWLYSREGTARIEPVKGGNLFVNLPYSEARWTWMLVEIPLAGSGEWTRMDAGRFELKEITALGLALDSWGGDPFTVWVDGLSVE